MVRVFVYDQDDHVFELYNRNPDDPMPYNEGNSLLVKEFMKNSNTDTIWTTKDMMEDWNKTRQVWKRPVQVKDGFHRISEPGYAPRSNVTAGVYLSLENMSEEVQNAFYLTISPYRYWTFINDPQYTAGYIELTDSYKPPACEYVSYPLLRINDISTYVLALQDALGFLNYLPANYLTGQFDNNTKNAVMKYQTDHKLRVDGVAGCNTWQSLIAEINKKNNYTEL